MVNCSYPKCKNCAEIMLGMADSDAEQIPYCKKCSKKVRMNTLIKIAENSVMRFYRKNKKLMNKLGEKQDD